jgi:GTP cyclohydrolase I
MHFLRENLFLCSMEVINNGLGENQSGGYDRLDRWDEKTTAALTKHYAEILKQLGENGAREGLKETPARVAKAMQFLTQGYGTDPADILRTAMFHEDYSEMVLVKDIELFSMCEHHMLPFIGKAHVAYIPDGRITG